jgi:hypothetical protein
MRLIMLAWIVSLSAGAAQADSINSNISLNDGISSLSGLEQSNFGAGNSVYSILSGDSGPWTSPQNQALLGNLRNLILTLGGDGALIAQLFQPGAVFAQPYIAPPLVPVIQGFSSDLPSGVPEPATMSFLGGAMFFLSIYALFRVRKRWHVTRTSLTREHSITY